MAELSFVDLSVPIQEPGEGELAGDLAPILAATIDYKDHDDAEGDARVMGCTPADFPGGLGWAAETLSLSTHSGTHVDAPYHYYPTTAGRPAKRIDEVPLRDFFGDGVVLDLTSYGPGDRVELDGIREATAATGRDPDPGEIVLLRFDADLTFGSPEYWTKYPGMSAEATLWLIERGVRLIGTDAVGFDRDFPSIAADFAETGDRSRLWEAHRVGIEHEYFQIEKLANLAALPTRGFKVAAFPVKITGASAAWTRAVAILGM